MAQTTPDALRLPPRSKSALTSPHLLAARFHELIGHPFKLTGKTRTDGSNFRKLVGGVLKRSPLPESCEPENFQVIPPKKKGIPRILREFLDTYIVTSGDTYNLQVWNRNPSANDIQIEFSATAGLFANDVRFALGKIDVVAQEVSSIVLLTPDYIVRHFGPFGKPTIKQQMIISPKARSRVLSSTPPVIFHEDVEEIRPSASAQADLSTERCAATPKSPKLLSLRAIRDCVLPLLGARLDPGPTKNRGQALEARVLNLLGYPRQDCLLGGYPDLRHQGLEIKVQDAPTIDLGKFSPQFDEAAPSCEPFTTRSVRYLIALTDEQTSIIRGLVLCPGAMLGNYFSYVSDASYKCQRTIPMSFFEYFKGQSIFNPAWPL